MKFCPFNKSCPESDFGSLDFCMYNWKDCEIYERKMAIQENNLVENFEHEIKMRSEKENYFI